MTLQFSVHYSKWPLNMSLALMNLLLSMIYFMNYSNKSLLIFMLVYLGFTMTLWMKDLNQEFTLKGWGSCFMITMFKMGFIIFIFSEIMFFVSFFWSYFHFLLLMGDMGNYPGCNLLAPDYKYLALLNTLLLLSSGVSLTNGHLCLMKSMYKPYMMNMGVTLGLGLLFTSCQLLEYKQMNFTIMEGCYSSIFYLTTGFHGVHVLIGSFMLFFIYMKTFPMSFLSFELASWYWHFVDIVWLFLYTFFYWLMN